MHGWVAAFFVVFPRRLLRPCLERLGIAKIFFLLLVMVGIDLRMMSANGDRRSKDRRR